MSDQEIRDLIDLLRSREKFVSLGPMHILSTGRRAADALEQLLASRPAVADQVSAEPVGVFYVGKTSTWVEWRSDDPLPDCTELYTHPAPQAVTRDIDQHEIIAALQKALAYWMPKVFDERSAHDAYLLVGYEGETEQTCWGDQMVAAVTRDDDLRKFLDVAAGEGYIFDGVDAGDLYERLFPEDYQAHLKDQS